MAGERATKRLSLNQQRRKAPRVARMKLSELQPASYNPRRISERAKQGLAASIDRYGLVELIVYNERTGNIVGGHQRFDALLARGDKECDVVVVDLPLSEEKALNVTLNNTQIQGEFVTEQLQQLISDIALDLPAVVNELHIDDLMRNMDLDLNLLDSGPGQSDGEETQGQLGLAQPLIYSREQIARAAFEHYRERGFPYPPRVRHMALIEVNALAATSTDELLRSRTAAAVANAYHPQRYAVEVGGMRNVVEAYADDDWLATAISKQIDLGKRLPAHGGWFGLLSLTHGVQVASNFRPGAALYYMRRYCSADSVILDTSMGYGGRLVAFAASGCKKYIGIDPCAAQITGNAQLAADLMLRSGRDFELIHSAAEDVPLVRLRNKADFCFTSPPYFEKEHYSDEESQSWKRYNTWQRWVDDFLYPLARLQYAALKRDRYAVINVASKIVIKNKASEQHDLGEATKAAMLSAGFELQQTERYDLPTMNRNDSDEQDAFELFIIGYKR